jgi:hypothetical protein
VRTPEEDKNYQEVADYWNKYLEHNALRVKGGDTNAGAFLAWMVEAAGDMLREASYRWASTGYIFEKWNRLNNYLNSRDWTDPLSPREWADIEVLKKDIDKIPAKVPYTREIQAMLHSIIRRRPLFVYVHLKHLRPMIINMKGDGVDNPKKRNPKGGFGVPSIEGVGQEEINRRWKESKISRGGKGTNPIPEVIARWNRKLIKPNGSVLDYPPAGDSYTLEELRKAVGGYIEILHIRRLPGFIMIINEEGKMEGLPYNQIASKLMQGTITDESPRGLFKNHDYIVGNAVVCMSKDVK